jgi:alpha-amylase/alpha-mannosidase (GH57 family)
LSAARASHAPRAQALPALVAGSWVYGTFSTWIGEADKNRAWDLLAGAKQSYDLIYERLQADPARAAKAEALLTRLEGSDWFWWLGDYNPSDAVANFESLFRRNLVALYDTLGLTPPPQLAQSLGRGGGAPESGGTMRRGLSD